MKTINKIIGILGIALIAITTIGAVNATDDYFLHDGTSDVSCVSQHTYEKGILTIPINNHVAGLPTVGAWDYTPAPIPSLPDHDLNSVNDCDCDSDCDSASETHDDPSADHADDHSDSESKNINTGLNRDRF